MLMKIMWYDQKLQNSYSMDLVVRLFYQLLFSEVNNVNNELWTWEIHNNLVKTKHIVWIWGPNYHNTEAWLVQQPLKLKLGQISSMEDSQLNFGESLVII